jgi:hypothetical protein
MLSKHIACKHIFVNYYRVKRTFRGATISFDDNVEVKSFVAFAKIDKMLLEKLLKHLTIYECSGLNNNGKS